MTRRGKWAALALGCLAILAAVLLPYRAGLWLLFGWLTFPFRVLPDVSVNRPGLAVTATVAALLTAGVHGLGRGWLRGRADAAPAPRWRLRWSLAVVAGACLLFVAGTAMVALAHQVAWLGTSPDPLTAAALAQPSRSTNNLRQIGFAMHNYAAVYSHLPSGGTFGPDGTMLHSWETELLIFIGYTPHSIDKTLPWNHPNNAKAFHSVLPVFINGELTGADLRDAAGYGLSHYAANSRVLGANRSMKLEEIRDGLSTTLLAGEVNANFRPWGHPINYRDPSLGINRSPHGFGGRPGARGAAFLMADGSVRFVSERVSPEVLHALGTPQGGEEIDEGALAAPW